MCVCKLCEGKRERDRLGECVDYMKERERGTEYVCADYMKGRDLGTE